MTLRVFFWNGSNTKLLEGFYRVKQGGDSNQFGFLKGAYGCRNSTGEDGGLGFLVERKDK